MTKKVVGVLMAMVLVMLLTITPCLAEETEGPGPMGKVAMNKAFHAYCGVMSGLGLVFGSLVTILALLILATILCPRFTERVSDELKMRHLKCFLLGLVNVVFLIILVAVSRGILVIIVGPVLFILIILGWVGIADDLGRRMLRLINKEGNRLTRITFGWLVLFFSSIVPVVGWFIIFPYLTLSGCGAFVIALVGKKKPLNNVTGAGAAVPK